MDATTTAMEAYGGHGFKWKKKKTEQNMPPSCWCHVIQVSGRLTAPIRLKTVVLTPCFQLLWVKHGGNVVVWTAESSWQLDDTKRAEWSLGCVMSFCQSKSDWAQESRNPSDVLLYVRNRTKTDTVLKSTGNIWRRVSNCRGMMYFWLKRARANQNQTEFESVDRWGYTDIPNCH